MDKLFSLNLQRKHAASTSPWKPGDVFQALTGKTIAECKTIDDIDAAVVQARKLKGPLPFGSGTSTGCVVKSGDVFPHSAESAESISEQIDKSLEMRLA